MTRREPEFKRVDLRHLNPDEHNRPVGDVRDLAENMRAVGQLQPLLVFPRREGGYRVIAGHRRLAAAGLLGWPSLLVIVLDGATDLHLIMAAENMVRRELTPWQKAELAAFLLERHEKAEVASCFSLSPARVNCLARLKRELPPAAWNEFVKRDDKARVEDWIQLLPLPPEKQIELAQQNAKAKVAKKTRTTKEIHRKILDLPAKDIRGLALRWVLGLSEFPAKTATDSKLAGLTSPVVLLR